MLFSWHTYCFVEARSKPALLADIASLMHCGIAEHAAQAPSRSLSERDFDRVHRHSMCAFWYCRFNPNARNRNLTRLLWFSKIRSNGLLRKSFVLAPCSHSLPVEVDTYS